CAKAYASRRCVSTEAVPAAGTRPAASASWLNTSTRWRRVRAGLRMRVFSSSNRHRPVMSRLARLACATPEAISTRRVRAFLPAGAGPGRLPAVADLGRGLRADGPLAARLPFRHLQAERHRLLEGDMGQTARVEAQPQVYLEGPSGPEAGDGAAVVEDGPSQPQ